MDEPAAASPATSIRIPLLGGQVAVLGRPLKGWPQRIRLEIHPAPGVAGHAAIFERYELGTPGARRALVRETTITDTDAQRLDTEAIAWRDTVLAEEQRRSEAAAQAAAAAAAAASASARPTAHDWGSLEVRCWSSSAGTETLYNITSLDQFLALCAQPVGENVYLKWNEPQKLAILDADFHVRGRTPNAMEVEQLAATLQPSPAAWHPTSRGFHAIYAPTEGLAANELATAALVDHMAKSLVVAYGGTAEVLTRTRHPLSAHNGRVYGRIRRTPADANLAALQIFDKMSCSDAEAQEARDHLGLRLGQRLPHSHCVIDPGHASSSPNPVLVTEHGVFCFSCDGRTGNGFRSWGAIRKASGLPTQASPDAHIMRDAIKHFVPHAHVARLFEALAPALPQQHRRVLHRALLRRMHQPRDAQDADPLVEARIVSVFDRFPFVRDYDGLWRHEDSLRVVSPRLGRTEVAQCSAALRAVVTEDGIDLKADPTMVTCLANDGAVPGFYPVMPSVPSPIWHQHHLGLENGYLSAQPRVPHGDPLRYLHPGSRMTLAEAKEAINQRWPGINFEYLTLLHCARGWGEEGRSQIPMIWASGETSTGKTNTVRVECAMHDEVPENLVIETDNLDSLNNKIASAQGRTGFLMLDDFCKNLEGRQGLQRRNNITTMLLQYSRSVAYHAMYVGERTTRVRTPLVMTDMRHPAELVQHEQIGRRVHYVQLNRQVHWSGGFDNWWRGDLRAAVESWHSHLVDLYFGENPTPFTDIAAQLGFGLLRDAFGALEDETARRRLVSEFVQALLRRPEASGMDSDARTCTAEQMAVTRSTGPGWVILDLKARGPLEDVAETMCHALNYEFVCADGIKKMLEPYQPKLHEFLPFNEPVRIDVRGYRMTAVLVRLTSQFRTRPLKLGCSLLAPGATPDNLLDPSWTNEG